MSLEFRVGDVFERLSEIPDGSIDLIVTSPPFLALRSYLPSDHPDKDKEIGSEATPAQFLDTMLALSAEWGRVLAPHGSLCVELGDTYAGSTASGGDHKPHGEPTKYQRGDLATASEHRRTGSGWPKAKSKSMLDTLYPACLAYGRNLLTGEESPAGEWLIRNLICWARPNPPVGALGDKFRPATSYITVACRGKRWFDLDAVRTSLLVPEAATPAGARINKATANHAHDSRALGSGGASTTKPMMSNPAGAPPLDWHADDHPEDGDWLWKLSTRGYKGSHYATFPLELPKRLILAMCPPKVCTVCGVPSERITDVTHEPNRNTNGPQSIGQRSESPGFAVMADRTTTTIGWTDCGHDSWRSGVVLDPFAGSGTTLEAAQIVGRDAIGIDLDERNADLARERCGMFLEVAS